MLIIQNHFYLVKPVATPVSLDYWAIQATTCFYDLYKAVGDRNMTPMKQDKTKYEHLKLQPAQTRCLDTSTKDNK